MLSPGTLIHCEPDDPHFVAELAAAGLPAGGRQGHCYALADHEGFGMIEGEGADRLLRSVVVPVGQRNMGVGARLVDLLALRAAEFGVERLWLLTTTAADFFSRRGWNTVPRDAAPAAIRASDQFTTLCPASATLMMREACTMSLARRLCAEGLGTALLLAIVIGSGIMGERLAGGNVAIALLGNTLATGAGLVVLIHMFGPISGAHFNPVVTLAVWLGRQISGRDALFFVGAQFVGAVLGAWLAHAMFAEPLLQVSHKLRAGSDQALSELVATFGLIGVILATQIKRPDFTPVAVGLYISAAYWFTASTSFANPAVTVARSLSDTFAGIAPACVPLFVAAQLAGALLGIGFFGWLYRKENAG